MSEMTIDKLAQRVNTALEAVVRGRMNSIKSKFIENAVSDFREAATKIIYETEDECLIAAIDGCKAFGFDDKLTIYFDKPTPPPLP